MQNTNFSLQFSQLDNLFPFFLLVNENLEIERCGKSIEKLFGPVTAQPLLQHFTITRPRTAKTDWKSLRQLQNQLVILGSVDNENSVMRGQFEYLEDQNAVLFIGSPWFSTVEQLKEQNLSLNDFAYHDPSIDLLYILKSQEITSQDLRQIIAHKMSQQAEMQRLSLVASANTNGVLFTSATGQITWANDAFYRLTGFSKDEIFGKTPVEICSGPLTNQATLDKIIRQFSQGEPFNVDIVYYRKDGSHFWGRTATQPIKNNFGLVTEYFGLIEDITEEKKQEEQIKVLSQIAEDNINAVIISDQAGTIKWVNKSFCEMTGYSVGEVLNKKPGHILQGEETDPDTVIYLASQIREGLPFNTEIVNYHKSGRKYWVRIQGQPIYDNNSVVTGFFALEEDITEQKETENRLRLVLEKLGDNVWEHDFKTDKTFFSKANNDLLGINLQEKSNNSEIWWRQVVEEDRYKLAESDRKYRNGEADSHSMEYRVKHADGTVRWVLDRGAVISKDSKGKPLKITGTHTDITSFKQTETELDNRVKQFQSLANNIPGILYEYEFRPDGTEGFRYVSPASEKILGLDIEKFNDYRIFLHPDDLEVIARKNRLSRETLAPFYDESRFIVEGKKMKWLSVQSAYSYTTENGSIIFTGLIVDITERKETEEKLEKQRKFYEDILNNLPADVAVFDKEHRYLFVNPRGIKDDEVRRWLIGKRDEDYCLLRNKPMSLSVERRAGFNKVLEYKKSYEWEEKVATRQGDDVYLLRRLFPVLNEENDVSIVIGYGLDITERKKSEEALRANEEKYRSIIANMNLGLMENDPEGRITYANQTLIKMSGIEEEEIIGFDSLAILSEDSRAFVRQQNVNRSLGISEAYELKVKVKNEYRWWLISSAPKFDDNHKFIGSIVICLDISEQKELQKQLIESREQAERLARTKELFLTNMSHEIRTPMNAIMGMSSQLAKTNLDGKQRFYLDTIHTAADNLLVIINDILDLSKIEAGKVSLESIGFRPKDIVKQSIQVLRHKADEKGLVIKNSYLDPELPSVLIGDPYRINQILLNLLSNAIKFTEKGYIDISVELKSTDDPVNRLLKFSVTDSGVGMEESFVEQLFEKFSQENESTTRKFGGTGLGMSICKHLVELMHGSIVVTSKKGSGTTVSFMIPCKTGTIADLPEEPKNKITTNFLRNRKILIADDNDLNRLVALTILKNYQAVVLEAADGEEALYITQKQMPELVLMDIQMPVKNGYEAARAIRQTNKSIPIIALTANAIKSELEKCIDAGMNDYITKPFKEEDFLNKIARHLGDNNDHEQQNNNTINARENELFDLASLEEISRGNKAFVKRILKLFCEQTPVQVNEMKKALLSGDYERVSAVAHKIKPSIDNLKIESLQKPVRQIENDARERVNLDDISSAIDLLQQTINKVVVQMQPHLND